MNFHLHPDGHATISLLKLDSSITKNIVFPKYPKEKHNSSVSSLYIAFKDFIQTNSLIIVILILVSVAFLVHVSFITLFGRKNLKTPKTDEVPTLRHGKKDDFILSMTR